MTFAMTLDGMKPLLRALDQMPQAMRSRVIVPAVTKGAKTIQRAIAPLIPVNKGGVKLRSRQAKRKRASDHYRNMLTSVVREYPLSSSVVGVIGAESGKAPHSILVESGTRWRFTNSKPKYERIGKFRQRTIIKNGKIVRKTERPKVSVGSVIRKKNKPQNSRGIMPAFHPVERGVKAASTSVQSQLSADIKSGIVRELTAAKLSRGKT